MKIKNFALSALLGCAMLGAPTLVKPAFAQRPAAQAEFDRYLAKHPNIRNHPELMNDPTWLREHPNFRQFRANHPKIAREARGMGDYDKRHQWHDRNWWVHNNRSWAYEHHRNWFPN